MSSIEQISLKINSAQASSAAAKDFKKIFFSFLANELTKYLSAPIDK